VEDDVNPECQTIARSIILLKLGSARDTVQDVEDVCSDVMARLLTPPGQDSRIVNLPAYVARTAFNACHDYFRRRVPEWRRSVGIGAVDAEVQVGPVESSSRDYHLRLEQIWREALDLPLRQRLALPLNLRAPEGGDALRLLPETDVAAKDEIAEALEMPLAELVALWEALPLDDATIASWLGVTRQQVINLRKSARQRLGRRASGNWAVQ